MHIHADIKEEKIREVCKSFTGNITQLPPLKSAVKRQERERSIYYLDILEIDGREVLFKVGCQAGTYIRKLCYDIGKKLGCGAHMAELRRTKAGPFDESTLTTLQQLQDAYITWKEEGKEDALRKCILPVEQGVKHLPKIWVTEFTVDSLCHGAALKIPGIAKLDDGIREKDVVAIMTLRGELIALGNAKLTTKEIFRKEKGIAATVDSVFMEVGTYPKMITND
jgi:H/ACA ribonucleoprotein complex subunit 4